jgi:hypothetical protein
MVDRVDALTAGQERQMAAHAARWIGIGLATAPAERRAFEEAARRCHVYAGVPWHGNVVWMNSPLTLALAALLLQSRLRPTGAALTALLRYAALSCLGEQAWDEIQHALEAACVCSADADGLTPWAEGSVVSRAIISTVRDAPAAALQRTFGLWGAVHRRVERTLESAIQTVVLDALRDIGRAVDRAVQNAVWDLCSEVRGELRAALTLAMAEVFGRAHFILKGPLDLFSADIGRPPHSATPHPSCTSFLREVCGLELPGGVWDRSHAYEQTMRTAGWWFPHRGALLVCERPSQIHLEPAQGRPGTQQLHSAAGAAMSWPGGWSLHAWHGCLTPGWIIEHPDLITVPHIERAENAEVRRVMIERYGWERYIRDCGATVVDSVPMDHPIPGLRGARLLRKDLPGEPEPIVYLDMVNSTPEPDGTRRHYLERIKPHAYGGDAARWCHAAMASRWHHRDSNGELQRTFERWQDYVPAAES